MTAVRWQDFSHEHTCAHTHTHALHTHNHIQSDLGYLATSGPAHIRISDLAGYERYMYA